MIVFSFTKEITRRRGKHISVAAPTSHCGRAFGIDWTGGAFRYCPAVSLLLSLSRPFATFKSPLDSKTFLLCHSISFDFSCVCTHYISLASYAFHFCIPTSNSCVARRREKKPSSCSLLEIKSFYVPFLFFIKIISFSLSLSLAFIHSFFHFLLFSIFTTIHSATKWP